MLSSSLTAPRAVGFLPPLPTSRQFVFPGLPGFCPHREDEEIVHDQKEGTARQASQGASEDPCQGEGCRAAADGCGSRLRNPSHHARAPDERRPPAREASVQEHPRKPGTRGLAPLISPASRGGLALACQGWPSSFWICLFEGIQKAGRMADPLHCKPPKKTAPLREDAHFPRFPYFFDHFRMVQRETLTPSRSSRSFASASENPFW